MPIKAKRRMTMERFPEFRPHPLIRGGHMQTLASVFLPWKRNVRLNSVKHPVELPDGDTLILHDHQSDQWRTGDRVVLLLHGLAGCHGSPYMIRGSSKLGERGVRTFRLDHRGCGAGIGLAQRSYHAGRSDDLFHAVQFVTRLCPESPLGVVGFSLSGNILLKYLGEDPARVPSQLDRAIAVNPPIDLKQSVAALNRFSNRLYDRHFVRLLWNGIKNLERDDGEMALSPRRPARLYDFDDQFTAPAAGFQNAEQYYARCSAKQFLGGILTRTWIFTAADDPLVPVSQFDPSVQSDAVSLHVVPSGGHLGYISRPGRDPDRRWIDWRIVECFCLDHS